MTGTLSQNGAIRGLNKNLVLSSIRYMIQRTGLLPNIDVLLMLRFRNPVLKWLFQNQLQKMSSFLTCYLARIVVHKTIT